MKLLIINDDGDDDIIWWRRQFQGERRGSKFIIPVNNTMTIEEKYYLTLFSVGWNGM
jgi:hypothetical protein